MKRYISALIAVLLLTLGLSACSSETGLIKGTEVTLGQIGQIASLNTDVAGADGGERNAAELANLTTAKFYEQNAQGQLEANTKLGTVEVLGQAPLTVKYSLAEGAAWSDGTPIDASDLALSLAAGSSLAGLNFYSIRSAGGLALASLAEQPKVGDLSITVKFTTPVADYLTAITLAAPAHIIAKSVNAGLDVSAAKKLVLDAINSQDQAQLVKITEAYRSGYNTWSGVTDADLFVSSGPYQVIEAKSNIALTLVANPNYQLGAQARIETIHLKYFVDSPAAVSALSDGSVDATSTLDSGLVTLSDLIGLVSEIKNVNVTPALRAGTSAEQIIFNFKPQSRFSAERNGNDADKALKLRQAFMNLIPRNRIVSGLSNAYKVSVSDSLVFQSSSPYYRASAQDNGLNAYLIQDAEKASEMLASSGVSVPMKVRVAYDVTNPRAQAEWILLSERAAAAGFNLKAVGGEDLQATLESGDFEVYLGPRPLVSLPGQNSFGLINESFVGYQNAEVRSALEQYAVADDDQQRASVLKRIDQLLVSDAYGMPLYEVASLVIYSDRIVGFEVAPQAQSVTWGYQNWSIKPKATS
ncbi:MAG: ABC transporter substrate-binding protein [Microbacteriaceae bacterium]